MFYVLKNIGRPEKDGLVLIALTRADWTFNRLKEDGLCLVALKRADLYENIIRGAQNVLHPS